MCVLQQNLPDQDDRPAEPPAAPESLPHDPDSRAAGREDDSGATNHALS